MVELAADANSVVPDKQAEHRLNISVVIPTYNSSESLPELILRLESVLLQLSDCYEVILVNDGSPDNTWETIAKLMTEHEWVHGIDLMRNYGQHNALLCGIRAAKNPVIVTLDDDLQHPPEEIPKLLAKLSVGYDVVYGAPQQRQHGALRNAASVVTRVVLQGAMGKGAARNISAFRVLRTQVREAFASYNSPYVSLDVLLTWGTSRFAIVYVNHQPRQLGKSNYTVWKLVSHATTLLTGFSSLPLQIASLVGFGFTLFGFGVLAYVLTRYVIEGGSVSGFPFLACMIAIFSGAQLFALGMIGEYLARMHFRLMEKPCYVARAYPQAVLSEQQSNGCGKGVSH